MKNFVITALIVFALGYGWGYLVGEIVAPPVSLFIAGIGGFIIGFAGGPAIYEWLESRE